jgi:cytochrome c2
MCHVVDSQRRKTGPSLQGIANRAGERVEGLDAVEYLRQSILDPQAYDADPQRTTRMYTGFGQVFGEQDLNNLIAYLLTLQ